MLLLLRKSFPKLPVWVRGKTGSHQIINTCWADLARFATFNFVVPKGKVWGKIHYAPCWLFSLVFQPITPSPPPGVWVQHSYAVMFRFDENCCCVQSDKVANENGFIIWQSRWRCVPWFKVGKRLHAQLSLWPGSHLFCFYFRRRCWLPLPSDLRMTQHSNSNLRTHTFKRVGKDNNDGNHNDRRYRINSTV